MERLKKPEESNTRNGEATSGTTEKATTDDSMHAGMRRAPSSASEVVVNLNASSHHGADQYQRYLEETNRGPLEVTHGNGPKGEPTSRADSKQGSTCVWLKRALWIYLLKFKGGSESPVPIPTVLDIFWSWVGAFLGILLLSGLTQWLEPNFNLPLLYASFGASAVLVFGVITVPLAQPRNFIGGQILSAVVGCAVRLALRDVLWVSAPLGMSLALVVMMLTKTTHPPGGATALIAATMDPLLPWQGFKFVICILIGSVGMLLLALLVNNLHPTKKYPTYWFNQYF